MSAERPIATRSGRRAGQDEAELSWLIAIFQAKPVRRYLEIGARYGDSFYRIMSELPIGSTGLAVDLPGDVWGKSDSEKHLRAAARELTAGGRPCEVLTGDSHLPAMLQAVRARAPFDAIFIDGDVRFREGVIDHQHVDILGGLAIGGDDLAARRVQGLAPGALALVVAGGKQDSRGAAHSTPIIYKGG